MSAALTQRPTPALTTYDLCQSRDTNLAFGLCGVVAVFGLVAIPLALTTQPMTDSVNTVIRLFVGLCCLLAWVQGHTLAHSVARGAAVLGERQVPQCLWAGWLRVALLQTARVWCVVVLACIVVLSASPSPWRWPTAAALVSLLMVLSLLRTLASQGLLAAAVGWIVGVALFAVVVGFIATTGLASVLDAIAGWPMVLQILLLVGGPAAALGLHSRWVGAAPKAVRPFSLPLAAWHWLKRELGRYHALNYFGAWQSRIQAHSAKGAGRTAPVMPLMLFVTMGPQLRWVTGNWGGSLELWHPLILMLMVMMFWPSLLCKDLHWRMLLAPGGLRRGRLGFYIARSTAEQTFIIACALLLVAWAVSTVFPGVPVLDVLGLLQHFALLPVQLFFAISVATLLRSLPRAGWIMGGLMVVLVVSFAAWVTYRSALPRAPDWFRAGPGYVALLVALSGAAIALSNRLWTTQKLMDATSSMDRRKP